MSGPSSSRFRVVPFLLLILCLGLAIVGYGWYSYRQPDAILNRGRAAIARSDFDSAFVLADQLESRREVSLSHLLRGELFLAQNRFPEALHQFNQIKESGDIHLRTALLSGRCLLEMRNLPEAEKVYSYVLEMDPDQIDAYRGLAAIAYDFGLLTRSLDYLDQVVKRDPGDGRAHRFQGLIHKDMAAYGEAEQSYRKALECSLPPAAKEEVRKE
ncbi:MAG: tetratricopeptide repeat protein, partial [Gemmataceae bacterium]